ncbi:hypothetical protein C2845_PM01G22220 [Panicum miliaceum]|uniref:Uncharacterized protein n=1 Tax=Panicum miliaceum TaxID=4540 RepID=A0A3L6TUX5_PANMI|nr:hypothetical protein C2845_PM01G22220 [Panicum miliaceum]
MSRRGKSASQHGGGPAKRSVGTSASPLVPPAPPQGVSVLSDSPPPPPSAPYWPGFGGSSGPSSSPHGNQAPNPWAGYLNILQPTYFPPPPQQLGENFHFVGLSKHLNLPSPAPPPCTTRTQTEKNSIEIDDDDGVAASKSVKKRYWSHEEEVRLASSWLNTSKDPIHGNDNKGDSF